MACSSRSAALALLREVTSHKEAFYEGPPNLSVKVAALPNAYQGKRKGIPALHWTTVHSAFGNRDRSGKKTFPVAYKSVASSTRQLAASRVKTLPTGLFDPTLKSDQLEADERRRVLQQRRRLRELKHEDVAYQPVQALEFPLVRRQPSGRPVSASTCHNRRSPQLQSQWKREASLAELLLSGPTLRKTLSQQEEIDKPSIPPCGSLMPHGPLGIVGTNLEELVYNDKFEQENMAWRKTLQKQVKLQTIRHKQQETEQRRQHWPGRGQSADAGKGKEPACNVMSNVLGDNSRDIYHKTIGQHSLPQRRTPAKRKLGSASRNGHFDKDSEPLSGVPEAEGLGVANESACKVTGTSQTCDAQYLAHQEDLGDNERQAALDSEQGYLWRFTLQRLRGLQDKILAATREQPATNAEVGSDARKSQLRFEEILMELADVIRNGPAGRTAQGTAYLLAFLQEQQDQTLDAAKLLCLVKRLRYCLKRSTQSVASRCCRRPRSATTRYTESLRLCSVRCGSEKRCSSALRHLGQETVMGVVTSVSAGESLKVLRQPWPPSEAAALNGKSGRAPPSTVGRCTSGPAPQQAQAKEVGQVQRCKVQEELVEEQQETDKPNNAQVSLKSERREAPDAGARHNTQPPPAQHAPTCQRKDTAKQQTLSFPATTVQEQQHAGQPDKGFSEQNVEFDSCYLRREQTQLQQGSCRQLPPLGPQPLLAESTIHEVINCFIKVYEADCQAAATLQSIERRSNLSGQEYEMPFSVQKPLVCGNELLAGHVPGCNYVASQSLTPHSQDAMSYVDVKNRMLDAADPGRQCKLSPEAAKRIMAFRVLRRQMKFSAEPLLEDAGVQRALHQMKQHSGTFRGFDGEAAGVWTLHAATAEHVLASEVQELVCCTNAAICTFVNSILEAEAARVVELMQQTGQTLNSTILEHS